VENKKRDGGSARSMNSIYTVKNIKVPLLDHPEAGLQDIFGKLRYAQGDLTQFA
jgi:hypothetical protein